MTTLFFKVWLVMLWLCTTQVRDIDIDNGAYVKDTICICVNHRTDIASFMDKEKHIYQVSPAEDWMDGDWCIMGFYDNGTPDDTSDDVIASTVYSGFVWIYDNKGTFTKIAYPWWYTGKHHKVVHTKLVY